MTAPSPKIGRPPPGSGPARAQARRTPLRGAGSARTTSMLSGGQSSERSRHEVAQSPLHQVPGHGSPTALETTKPTRGAAGRPDRRARSTGPAGGPPAVGHRSDGRGARPHGSERARSDGYWRRARPAAHASGSEAVAALAAAGGQDGAAGAGAHPQAEAVGLVPTAVVRLERTLAHGFTPLEGLGERSDLRATSGPLWSTQHRAPTTRWTVVDMRHRSTPVSTCQRYALAAHRVNSAALPAVASPSPPAGPPSPALRPPLDHQGTSVACSAATRRSLWVCPL